MAKKEYSIPIKEIIPLILIIQLIDYQLIGLIRDLCRLFNTLVL